MAYDEGLAQRIREQLQERTDVEEKKMFGGLCFMVSNHMCCGIMNDTLLARVGPERYDDSLTKSHVSQMDFTGKPMEGFVVVEAQGLSSEGELADWINTCLNFVKSLPPKKN